MTPTPAHSLPGRPTQPGPLSDAQLAELAGGKQAARRLRRTAGVAKISAWTTGVLAALTLLGGFFGDMTSLVLGAAIMGVAIREGRLSSRLGAFDVRAPRLLALNQTTLGGVIILYAAWQTWQTGGSNGLSAGAQPIGDPQVDAMLADIGSQVRPFIIGFYLCVGLCGALGTGLMALYYARRGALVRAFLANQPAWVVQAMRAAA